MVSNIGTSMDWPTPVFSRRYSAAQTAFTAAMPTVRSTIAIGT